MYINIDPEKQISFLKVWGSLCALTFIVQVLIQLSGLVAYSLPGFIDLTTVIEVIIWRADIVATFAGLTILATFLIGLYQLILKGDANRGIGFLVVASGLAVLIGGIFFLLNFTDLFGAIIEVVAAGLEGETTALEWSFTLYGSIITGLIALPAFLVGFNYIRMITSVKQ
jgi:hypothetical protein